MPTTAFLRAGLSGDYGRTCFWTQIFGNVQARELHLLSPKIGAEEALRRGMMHRVFPDDLLIVQIRAIVREMDEMPPLALNYAKRNLNWRRTPNSNRCSKRKQWQSGWLLGPPVKVGGSC
jgi:2-(1,2-epoxy-1,2-dihydrophenyl)acetyl-CoA isomerase